MGFEEDGDPMSPKTPINFSQDDPPIVAKVLRRSVDLLKSDKLARVTPFDEQKGRNTPNIKGSSSWPLSPSYPSVPNIVASHHDGQMKHHIDHQDTPLSVLFRHGSIQQKLFQYLNARDVMTLCSTDSNIRRHTKMILANQSPPANPDEPISIQDIRPHHYPTDERCDAVLSFDVRPLQISRFAHSIEFRGRGTVSKRQSNCWSDGAEKFPFTNAQGQPNPHLPRSEEHFNRRKYIHRPDLYQRFGWREYDFIRHHPKDFSDFYCCRRAKHKTQYKVTGEPMVSCSLCLVDARYLLEFDFMENGWWRPVCFPCHTKARAFFPNGYQSCQCIESMITETCWACIDRMMADFERREYDTTQRFPRNYRTMRGRNNAFIFNFEDISHFLERPKGTFDQLKFRIENFIDRRWNPKDTNKYCWPVCPCGEQISRIKHEYPNQFSLVGLPEPIYRVLNNPVNGWTKVCLACDGIVVQHPDFFEDPPVRPQEMGKERFRKALGFGGAKTIVEDWARRGLVMRPDWPPFDFERQGHKKIGYGMGLQGYT